MKLAWVLVTCTGLAVGLGCSRTPSEDGHAGQSGSAAGTGGRAGAGGGAAGAAGTSWGTDAGTIDAASVSDGAGDAAPDGGTDGPGDSGSDAGLSFSGRRSYYVTASPTAAPDVNGPVSVPSHQFTIVIDADTKQAILGDGSGAQIVPFTVTPAGPLTFGGPIRFSNSALNVQYTTMFISSLTQGALTGDAKGTANIYTSDDTFRTTTVVASLTGVPDTMPPVLTVVRDGAEDDPFSSLTVTTREPLPPDARPTLVTVSGTTTPLVLPNGGDSRFVYIFYGPGTLLRYGQDYQVRIDGITDFAGLPASGGAAFTTRAAPPLVSEDGFESAAGATLGGTQVLTGTGAPTISAARSLYIPPVAAPVGRPRTTRLALRLAVTSGDTVVRFAYRLVNPLSGGNPLLVCAGSEGGKLGCVQIGSGMATTTTATIPGQGDVSLGPIAAGELPLPVDVGSEIVFAETLSAWKGGMPAPPTPGIIIDDLRVE